jgi:uncharacterized protein (DUF1501 family)
MNRRDFIYTGLVGGLGLSMGDILKLQAESPQLKAKAQSVIHIYLPGGFAAQETFDPHPNAPSEYRGPLGTVPTKITGVHFSEYLKQTAKIADKLTVVRSMTHGEAAHERGTTSMFTGYRPSPALEYPSFGSVIAHELGDRKSLPAYVCVPQKLTSNGNDPADSGFLSKAYGPFSLGSDPASEKFKVRDLNLPDNVSEERFLKRRSILETVDSHFKYIETSDAVASMDTFYQKAYDLIASPEARAAFDINKEPTNLKEMYGLNQAGQRLLMARRLVESGVRYVSVTYGGWDMHTNISKGISTQLPAFDQAYAALIKDLEQRGMLDSTLVMISSEFGRTPKINKDAGRDHWPRVFSVVFAGGGFKKGFVYGASDATGSDVEENPLTVENLAATMYNQMGIDPNKALMADGGRPVSIVKDGHVVSDLLC